MSGSGPIKTGTAEDLDDRHLVINKIGRPREPVPLPEGPLLLLHDDGPRPLAARRPPAARCPLPAFD